MRYQVCSAVLSRIISTHASAGRRYATFKLFYHDHTPDDYEPPYFRSGDSKKDKWYFTTHEKAEVPEKCSVGQVQTGWHGVDLRVASVSGYLPSAEDNNAPFMGTTAGDTSALTAPLTPAEESEIRRQQAEVQLQDAQNRRIVWDAEEGLADVDADGEVDDGQLHAIIHSSNGLPITAIAGDESQTMGVWRISGQGLEFISPIGMLDDDGNLVPLSKEPETDKHDIAPSNAALFNGVEEKVPRHVAQLVRLHECVDGVSDHRGFHRTSHPATLENLRRRSASIPLREIKHLLRCLLRPAHRFHPRNHRRLRTVGCLRVCRRDFLH